MWHAGGPPKIPLEVILGKIYPISGLFFGSFWRSYPDCPPVHENFEILSGLLGTSSEEYTKKSRASRVILRNLKLNYRSRLNHNLPQPRQLVTCLSWPLLQKQCFAWMSEISGTFHSQHPSVARMSQKSSEQLRALKGSPCYEEVHTAWLQGH